MKRFFSIALFMMLVLMGMGQNDSIAVESPVPIAIGSLDQKQKTKREWIPFSVGLNWVDGGANYFEGYSYTRLRSNVQVGTLGFPIHNDWLLFTPFTTQPRYFEAGGFFQLADTNLNLRIRFTGSYVEIHDSMFYQSGFSVDDTVFRRIGTEHTRLISLGGSMMKTSRNFGKFFRLYAGGMGEAFAATKSSITYTETAFDISEDRNVQRNDFEFNGKPRLNLYASAVAGVEFTFFQRLGITGELRSGIGTQLKVGEKPAGIAKTLYMVGMQYYLVPNIGNARKKQPVPLEDKEFRYRGDGEKRRQKEREEELKRKEQEELKKKEEAAEDEDQSIGIKSVL